MSLWRVKHTLSPTSEKILILLAVGYGVLAIYLASIHPLVVITTAEIRNVPAAVDLDTDTWRRARNEEHRFLYGVLPGWVVDDSDPDRILMARAPGYLKTDSHRGTRVVIEVRPLHERNQIENIAARELVGKRPALYDVGVHGRSGLFAVVFDGRDIVDQIVYAADRDRILIFRGGALDPAAFSALISTVKFLPPVGDQTFEE